MRALVIALLSVVTLVGGSLARAQSLQDPSGLVRVLGFISPDTFTIGTGVVLNAHGDVLVRHKPLQQASRIVVLDGGSDIDRDAKPAQLIWSSVPLDVAVLRAEGLGQKPIRLSEASQPIGTAAHRQVFPSRPGPGLRDPTPSNTPVSVAEALQVAAGVDTVDIARYRAAAGDPGPLFNDCGELIGFEVEGEALKTGQPVQGTTTGLSATAIAKLLRRINIAFTAAPLPCSAPPSAGAEGVRNDAPALASAEERSRSSTSHPAEPLAAPAVPPSQAIPPPTATGPLGLLDGAPVWAALATAGAGVAAGLWILRRARNSRPVRAAAAGGPAPGTEGSAAPAAPGIPKGWVLTGATDAGMPIHCAIEPEALQSKGLLVVGRSSSCCDIVLEHKTISRRHAAIALGARGLMIRDLDSVNGTLVNGHPLQPRLEVDLPVGSSITLGLVALRLTAR